RTERVLLTRPRKPSPHSSVPTLPRGNACWDALRPGLTACRLLARTQERPGRGYHAERGSHRFGRALRPVQLPCSLLAGALHPDERASTWTSSTSTQPWTIIKCTNIKRGTRRRIPK